MRGLAAIILLRIHPERPDLRRSNTVEATPTYPRFQRVSFVSLNAPNFQVGDLVEARGLLQT